MFRNSPNDVADGLRLIVGRKYDKKLVPFRGHLDVMEIMRRSPRSLIPTGLIGKREVPEGRRTDTDAP
jgi:hypothetical protein